MRLWGDRPRCSCGSDPLVPARNVVAQTLSLAAPRLRTPDVAPQFLPGGENGLSHSWKARQHFRAFTASCENSRRGADFSLRRASARPPANDVRPAAGELKSAAG